MFTVSKYKPLHPGLSLPLYKVKCPPNLQTSMYFNEINSFIKSLAVFLFYLIFWILLLIDYRFYFCLTIYYGRAGSFLVSLYTLLDLTMTFTQYVFRKSYWTRERHLKKCSLWNHSWSQHSLSKITLTQKFSLLLLSCYLSLFSHRHFLIALWPSML